MKNEIVLIGGGGHCKSVIDVIELENKYTIAGIIDMPEKLGQDILGYKIIGNDNDIEILSKKYSFFFITLGQIKSPERRINLYHKLKKLNVKLPVIKSPLAHVSKHAKLGEGTIIMHQGIVNADTSIGVNCIINTKALVEHDCVIEDHCHISTHATINGNVVVGARSFFGSNAVSRESIAIVPDSFIKANSLVK